MKLYDLPATAALLGISLSTLRDLHRNAGLPIIRLSSRTARVSEDALQEWLDSRTWLGGRGDQAAASKSAWTVLAE